MSAAISYGTTGAILALWAMGAPFGFMSFLGLIGLGRVIVSHVIALSDFVEEEREKGNPFCYA